MKKQNHIGETEKSYENASWYQEKPEVSLKFIEELELPFTSKIIEIGCGDSNLVDFLLKASYRDISVLDISEKPLRKANNRLCAEAKKINWIGVDASEFQPTQLWHDRPSFHYLTEDHQIERFLRILENSIVSGGFVILATNSKNHPEKCSGRCISQYSAEDLQYLLQDKFELLEYENVDHKIPTGAIQNFTFCCFRKK